MKRKLFLVGLAFTAVELGLDLVLLFAIFPLRRNEAIAGAVSLAPVLGVSTLYWLYFSSRWMRGLDGEQGLQAAREAVVRFPRRSFLYRSFAVGGLGILLAPTLAGIAGVDVSAAGVIAGTITCVGFATNAVRAYFYRLLLAPAGADLYATEPLRYLARCLRERLFVAALIVGFVGVAVALLYVRFVVGVPVVEVASALVLAPLVLAVTLSLTSIDMWRATAPLLPYLVPDRQSSATSPSVAMRIASNAPYRFVGTALAAWVIGGAAAAVVHHARGGLATDGLQIFAGIVAVGVGVLPYQVAWHRRILLPAREAAAVSLAALQAGPQRSRLSLRAKLVVSFITLIAFGGTFAVLGTFAEHERFLAAAAEAEAVARRDVLLAANGERALAAGADPHKLEELAQSLSDERERVVAIFDGKMLGEETALPPDLAAAVLAGFPGYGALPRIQASLAFAPVGPTTALGVLKPWRDPGGRDVTPLVFVFAALALASAGLVLVTAQDLTGPLRSLAQTARQVGQGDLSRPIPAPDSDEMGELAAAMDWSRRELAAKIKSIEELNASLEQRVQQRTAELELANQDLTATLGQLQKAKQDIVHAEKMASLGRLVAGIAHEINNPLNFVQNSLGPLKKAVNQLSKLVELAPQASDDERALVQKAQAAGELRRAAGLDATLADVDDLLRVMGNGVARMGAIVRALRDFSRQSAEDAVEPVELEQLVDDAAALLRHELKGRVEIVKALEPPSRLICQAGPMTQVFMNLFKNAAQAIDGPGSIRVSSRVVDGGVEIKVADTGRGIPPEALPKIFEPFFTTKPVGEGTGLGLAIVHGIVEKHGGRIGCASRAGEGTEFTLFVPQTPPTPANGGPEGSHAL